MILRLFRLVGLRLHGLRLHTHASTFCRLVTPRLVTHGWLHGYGCGYGLVVTVTVGFTVTFTFTAGLHTRLITLWFTVGSGYTRWLVGWSVVTLVAVRSRTHAHTHAYTHVTRGLHTHGLRLVYTVTVTPGLHRLRIWVTHGWVGYVCRFTHTRFTTHGYTHAVGKPGFWFTPVTHTRLHTHTLRLHTHSRSVGCLHYPTRLTRSRFGYHTVHHGCPHTRLQLTHTHTPLVTVGLDFGLVTHTRTRLLLLPLIYGSGSLVGWSFAFAVGWMLRVDLRSVYDLRCWSVPTGFRLR